MIVLAYVGGAWFALAAVVAVVVGRSIRYSRTGPSTVTPHSSRVPDFVPPEWTQQ